MAKLHLAPDYKEFVELLNSKGIKYIIVGGYAVAWHGYPRFTGDINFWLAISKDNAHKTVEALNEFGFGSLNITDEDFLQHDLVLQLGYPPVRIDLLTSLTDLDFDECYPKAIKANIDGIDAYILDKESLIKNKRATGRKRDIGDIEELS
jgi:predicted nucleotidyltransferase